MRRESMLRYSEKRTVLRERSSRKTVSFKEQTMSKDKYWSIFLSQKGAAVFIILQILISLGYSPVLAGTYLVT